MPTWTATVRICNECESEIWNDAPHDCKQAQINALRKRVEELEKLHATAFRALTGYGCGCHD